MRLLVRPQGCRSHWQYDPTFLLLWDGEDDRIPVTFSALGLCSILAVRGHSCTLCIPNTNYPHSLTVCIACTSINFNMIQNKTRDDAFIHTTIRARPTQLFASCNTTFNFYKDILGETRDLRARLLSLDEKYSP
jgi:hypothetical protein